MYNQNLIYQIGLTLVKGIGSITAKQIIETLGDAQQLFLEKGRLLERIPGISPRIVAEIHNPEVLRRAEREVLFIEKNQIKPLFITEADYPRRFKDCIDSPIILYFKGNTDLNTLRVVSIVGTRHVTAYGRDVTAHFIRDFAKEYPDLLIVSGLAYGVDIVAHQTALKEKLPTVAVLAHGLDRVYPDQHRHVAWEMTERGGLLSDFLSETNPDRQNFVKRNRIIAGVSDCTIVIESAEKGGALITANVADSYNKDVFAVPGRTNDVYSKGCNKLIKDKKAALVESAEDVMREMCWLKVPSSKPSQAIQRTFLLEFSPEEQAIINILTSVESMHLNLLAIELNVPVSKLSALLFDLEMNGVIRCFPGGMYRLY